MNSKNILLAIACSFVFGSFSCTDKDKKTDNKAVQTAFDSQYPGVKDTEWKIKNSYYVVEFDKPGVKDAEAWYDKDGKWLLTEYEVKFDKLPQAIQTSFNASKYKAWKIDDIKIQERLNMDNLYIVEVKNEADKNEMSLFYAETGLLIKEEPELDSQKLEPNILPEAISAFVHNNYPNARIIDTEKVYDNLEIDIINDKQSIEIMFNKDNQWLYTQWDITFNQLPDTVATEFKKTDYADYKIDEIKYKIQPNTIAQYLFELENDHGVEVNLTINEEGTIVNK